MAKARIQENTPNVERDHVGKQPASIRYSLVALAETNALLDDHTGAHELAQSGFDVIPDILSRHFFIRETSCSRAVVLIDIHNALQVIFQEANQLISAAADFKTSCETNVSSGSYFNQDILPPLWSSASLRMLRDVCFERNELALSSFVNRIPIHFSVFTASSHAVHLMSRQEPPNVVADRSEELNAYLPDYGQSQAEVVRSSFPQIKFSPNGVYLLSLVTGIYGLGARLALFWRRMVSFVAAATDAPVIRGCDGESNFRPPFNATGTVSFVTESFTHNNGKAWYLSVGLKDRRDKNAAYPGVQTVSGDVSLPDDYVRSAKTNTTQMCVYHLGQRNSTATPIMPIRSDCSTSVQPALAGLPDAYNTQPIFDLVLPYGDSKVDAFTAFDSHVRQSNPVLLIFGAKQDQDHGKIVMYDSKLLCVAPVNATAGSHVPKSSAVETRVPMAFLLLTAPMTLFGLFLC